MNDLQVCNVQKSSRDHRVKRPTQTGFSSPATHYNEPRIDLNDALVENASATFYIRVSDEGFQEYGISKDDVLIVDRSIAPSQNRLVVAVDRDAFCVLRIEATDHSEITIWGVITYIIKSVR